MKNVATNKLFISITSVCYLILLINIIPNLFNSELWYDEAGQVFIAHGLNHWSDPLSSDGTLFDVFTNNHDYNQDPGGFSVLLFLWCKISSYHVWLRFMSFIFFIGSIVFTCLITKQVLNDKILAYISGIMIFALISGPIAYEIRPYSMELCGVTYGIWMVLKLSQRSSYKEVLLLSMILCIFITSRYSMLIIGGLLSFLVICDFIFQHYKKQYSLKETILRVIIYSTPLIVMVLTVWMFQMRIQNSKIIPLSYIDYIQSPFLVSTYLIIAVMLVLSLKLQTERSRLLIYIFVILNGSFIILGYFKLLPWQVIGKRGALFLLSLYITIFNCGIIILRKNNQINKYIKLISLFCIIFYTSAVNGLIFYVETRQTSQKSRISQIEKLMNICPNKIFISSWNSPEIRYLYEYGELKKKAIDHGYPNHFFFLKKDKHCVGIKKIDYNTINANILSNAPAGSVVYCTSLDFDSIPSNYYEFNKDIFIKK